MGCIIKFFKNCFKKNKDISIINNITQNSQYNDQSLQYKDASSNKKSTKINSIPNSITVHSNKNIIIHQNFNNINNIQIINKNNDYSNFNEKSYFKKSEKSIIKNHFYINDVEEIEIKNSIKNYKIGKLLGSGAFGSVYQIIDQNTGKIYALKRISKHKFEDIDKIKREIHTLSKLHHKNIVKYIGYSETKNHLNIFLEYIKGGSLLKVLKSFKKLNEESIRIYTKQILEGLLYLHYNDIIHRDIKCANILLDDGICKLCDFGVSRRVEENYEFNQVYSIQGTPNWMAPEIWIKGECTRFSDIWSLGCTVIEMITGKIPFENQHNYHIIMHNILQYNIPPPLPLGISDSLKSFLEDCLRINPTERKNIYYLLNHPFIVGDTSNCLLDINLNISDSKKNENEFLIKKNSNSSEEDNDKK